MTGYIQKAWDAGKETIYATTAFAGIGAVTYGAGKYATAAVNYFGAHVTKVTKLLPFADAAGKGAAELGSVYKAAGVFAVGAFAVKFFDCAATQATEYVVEKTALKNVESWYAKKTGHFLVWTIATTATVASTAYFARGVLGLALTKSVLGASGAAAAFDALVKGKTIAVNSFNWAKAGTHLYFANRVLANAKYNEEEANIKLHGTGKAEIKVLEDSVKTLVEKKVDSDGNESIVPKTTITAEERKKYNDVQDKIKAIKNSKDPRVIGLLAELDEAKKLDQKVPENKTLTDKLQLEVDNLELSLKGREEVKSTDGKIEKEAVESLASKVTDAENVQKEAQMAYNKTWTQHKNQEIVG